MDEEIRKCSRCNIDKPLNEFVENFKKYINDEAPVKIEEIKSANEELIDLSKLIEESK